MPERSALPFLLVPPFPGARPASLVEPGDPPSSAPPIEAVVAALAQARVGGEYWAAQPVLPAEPYVLVRGDRAWPNGLDGGRVVRWLDKPTDQNRPGETVVIGSCDPWHLVSGAAAVACGGDDDLRLVAGLAGKPVVRAAGEKAMAMSPAELAQIADRLVAQWTYRNPFIGQREGALEAIAHCAAWRTLIDGNRALAGAYGFARWKRQTTEALLWNGTGSVRFDPPLGNLAANDPVAVWRSRAAPATLRALEDRSVALIEVEDGFIRSAGLGADCVPPLSIVVDRLGPHFDPRGESELEQLLERGSFAPALLEQAETLRQRIVATGVGKYDVGQAILPRRSDRAHVLVPGQVEDDRAVLSAVGEPLMNLALLEKARAAEPNSYLIYKPHPDVEAGHRRGAIPEALALTIADEVIRDQAMSSVIALSDQLHVNSSLAGFEALLRGRPVVTHGVPFYAGWGLTDDRGSVPARRTARRSLLELVAATLLIYPRYLDPITGLPCPPEVVVARLADGGTQAAPGALVTLRRLQGRLRQQLARLGGAA